MIGKGLGRESPKHRLPKLYELDLIVIKEVKMAGKRKIVWSCVEDWLDVLARVMGPFSLNPDNFSGPKSAFMYPVICFQDQNFNTFEHKTMKIRVKKANLTGL